MCRNQFWGAAVARGLGLSRISRAFFLFGLLIFYSTGAWAQTAWEPVRLVGTEPIRYYFTKGEAAQVFLPEVGVVQKTYSLTTRGGRLTLADLGLRFYGSRLLSGTPTLAGTGWALDGVGGFAFIYRSTYQIFGRPITQVFDVYITICDEGVSPCTADVAPTYTPLRLDNATKRGARVELFVGQPHSKHFSTVRGDTVTGTGNDPRIEYRMTGLAPGMSFSPSNPVINPSSVRLVGSPLRRTDGGTTLREFPAEFIVTDVASGQTLTPPVPFTQVIIEPPPTFARDTVTYHTDGLSRVETQLDAALDGHLSLAYSVDPLGDLSFQRSSGDSFIYQNSRFSVNFNRATRQAVFTRLQQSSGFVDFRLTATDNDYASTDTAIYFGHENRQAHQTVRVVFSEILRFPNQPDNLTFVSGQQVAATELPAAVGGVYPLRYTLSPPQGLTFASTPTTGANAGASGTRTLSGSPTAPGIYELTLTATDASGASVESLFTINVLGADTSRSEVAVSGSPAVADGVATLTFTATVRTANGHPVRSETVSFASTAGVNFSTSTCNTNASGQCLISATSTTAGTYRTAVNVAVGTIGTAEYSFVAGSFDGARSSVAVSGSPSVADDTTPVTITATVLDAHDNPVSGETVTFAATTDVNFSANTCSTDVGGRCSITATSTMASNFNTAASVGTVSIGTAAYSFVASDVNRARSSIVVSGSPATADSVAEVTFVVTVMDINSNLINAATVGFDDTTEVSFSASTCNTDSNGKCSITATSTTANTYNTAVTADSVSIGTAVYAFTAGAGATANSEIEVPDSMATADDTDAVTITATVRDANDNLAGGETVTFTATTDVNFSADTCTTDVGGQCSITATSTTAGTYSTAVGVTAGTIDTAAYTFIADVAVAATSEVATSDSPATADDTDTVTITAIVRDANNNPVSNEAAIFTDTANINFSLNTCTTDTSGRCSITATSITAGTYSTTASIAAGEITTAAEYVFDADVGVTANSRITVLGGPASANGNDAITLAAVVHDTNGNMVRDVTVSFADTTDVSFSSNTCDTDELGLCLITATSTKAGTYSTPISIAVGPIATAVYTFTANDRAFDTLNDAVLPDIAKSIADQNVGSVIRRIQDAFTARLADTPSAGFNLDGQSTLDRILAVQLADAENNGDEVNWKRMLAKSSFVLPMGTLGSVREPTFPVQAQVDGGDRGGATMPHPLPEITDFTGAALQPGTLLSAAVSETIADVPSTGLSKLVFWGAGGYRNFGGEPGNNDAGIDWDGDLLSLHFGADTLLNPNTLAGLAVSWSESEIDYTRDDNDSKNPGGEGAHILDMITLSPYIAWTSHSGKLHLWSTVGLGDGGLEIREEGLINSSSNASQQSIALGASGEFLKTNKGTAYRLRSEYMYTTLDIAGGDIVEQGVAARRFRLAVEAARSRDLGNGIRYEPRLELGIRHDAGAGDNGDVMELRARIYRNNAASGWRAHGSAYFLFGRDEYHEWGIEGSLRLAPPSVYGLRVSLAPSYGAVSKDARQLWDGRLWEQELPDVADQDQDQDENYEPTMQARVAYGLPALVGYGMMTPFGEATLGQDKRSFRFGVEWKLDALVDMELAGERDIDDSAETENIILLKGTLRF